MTPSPDRSWMSRFLSMGLRPDQMHGANRSGSLQQEAFVRQLLKDSKNKRHQLETPLDTITFIILDTETTGFSQHDDEIFAISATKMKAGNRIDSFSTLINPQKKVPQTIQELTGIKQSDVEDAPLLNEVMSTLLHFLTNGVLVGYHITHDLTFLNAFLKRTNQPKLPHQSFELRQIMEKTYRRSFPTLDDALAFHTIPCLHRHTADGDVKAMALLWETLFYEFKKDQLVTLYDLYVRVGS